MKIKWLAFAATLLFLTQPLLALAGDIEGVHGTWWNQGFAGEGFSIEQYDDGFIIAYWYTYDSEGNQRWLIGTGTMINNSVDLDMSYTRGGRMGSDDNPGLVTEEAWGVVSLHLLDCNTIDMSYLGNDGTLGGYQLQRIVNEPLAGTTCGEAEDEGQQGTVALQRSNAFGLWIVVGTPWVGTITIEKTYNTTSDDVTLYRLQLTAMEGQLRVAGINTSDSTGLTSPSVDGLHTGLTLPEGVPVVFELKAQRTYGETALPNFRISLQDVGDVINLTVRLRTN